MLTLFYAILITWRLQKYLMGVRQWGRLPSALVSLAGGLVLGYILSVLTLTACTIIMTDV